MSLTLFFSTEQTFISPCGYPWLVSSKYKKASGVNNNERCDDLSQYRLCTANEQTAIKTEYNHAIQLNCIWPLNNPATYHVSSGRIDGIHDVVPS